MTTEQISQIKDEKKLGGPYTRQEQEQRRKKVHTLYFENGQSAVKIAEILGVNRNTINSDIQYYYAMMVSQIGQDNTCGLLLKQIERLDFQRKRLFDELVKQSDFSSKLALEKMILEIDNKLIGIASKLMETKLRVDRFGMTEEIPEDDLSEIVKYLIFNSQDFQRGKLSESDMIGKIIKMKKCDIIYAKNAINSMRKLGLELYKSGSVDPTYDISKFALLREYIPKEELNSVLK